MTAPEMPRPRTIFEKIWDSHVITALADGYGLIYIDRHFFHEGSFHAFEKLRRMKLPVKEPSQTFGVADHYVPTHSRKIEDITGDDVRRPVELFSRNVRDFGLPAFDMSDRRQGIAHVVGPEQGLTLPGMTVVCGDSHTTTHGAIGALAFGIGASEVSHVLATQTLWQAPPKVMRISLNGRLPPGTSAKDAALLILSRLGASGAVGHFVEFCGDVVSALSIEGRLTLCNMSVELGGKAAIVAPDETTFDYIRDRAFAPKGEQFDRAVEYWRTLSSDPDCRREGAMDIDCAGLEPMVTWGTSPDTAVSISGRIPDPSTVPNPQRRTEMIEALSYMDLKPGAPITDIRIDRVFIGSCTNARIEDLREAAAIARRGKTVVPALISPGSTQVKADAEAEGLDRIFVDAGFRWGESGCSMCASINGDTLAPGERCASTTNRNFRGRQGPNVRTHLVSPAMAAAAALAGRFVDARELTRAS